MSVPKSYGYWDKIDYDVLAEGENESHNAEKDKMKEIAQGLKKENESEASQSLLQKLRARKIQKTNDKISRETTTKEELDKLISKTMMEIETSKPLRALNPEEAANRFSQCLNDVNEIYFVLGELRNDLPDLQKNNYEKVSLWCFKQCLLNLGELFFEQGMFLVSFHALKILLLKERNVDVGWQLTTKILCHLNSPLVANLHFEQAKHLSKMGKAMEEVEKQVKKLKHDRKMSPEMSPNSIEDLLSNDSSFLLKFNKYYSDLYRTANANEIDYKQVYNEAVLFMEDQFFKTAFLRLYFLYKASQSIIDRKILLSNISSCLLKLPKDCYATQALRFSDTLLREAVDSHDVKYIISGLFNRAQALEKMYYFKQAKRDIEFILRILDEDVTKIQHEDIDETSAIDFKGDRIEIVTPEELKIFIQDTHWEEVHHHEFEPNLKNEIQMELHIKKDYLKLFSFDSKVREDYDVLKDVSPKVYKEFLVAKFELMLRRVEASIRSIGGY